MADLRTLKRRIGQRMIFGFQGTRVPNDLIRLDEEWGLGGVVLNKKNLKNFDQSMDLTEQLWSLGGGIPPFIAVDQEGGAVHRLPKPFTTFPDMAQLGLVDSVSLAYEVGAVIGRELTAAGFNLDLAPVLDVNTRSDNALISRRALSSDPKRVADLGRAIVRGLHDNAVVACGKHFPGLGDATVDTHEALPVLDHTPERLRQIELLPFIQNLNQAPNLDLLMTGHVKYTKLDPQYPATLSRTILQDILRLELGYKGLLLCDDLEQKAITDNFPFEDAVMLALEAGIDVFMICGDRDRQVLAMETLLREAERGNYPKHLWERTYTRIRDIKARHFRVLRSIDRVHAREVVGNREHQRIARRLRDGK
jgi:beta-N-acetylhexosaminidase